MEMQQSIDRIGKGSTEQVLFEELEESVNISMYDTGIYNMTDNINTTTAPWKTNTRNYTFPVYSKVFHFAKPFVVDFVAVSARDIALNNSRGSCPRSRLALAIVGPASPKMAFVVLVASPVPAVGVLPA